MTEYRTSVSAGEGMDFVISDGSLDCHGTRINPDGWDLSHFTHNPVALWSHGLDPVRGRVPIGMWKNVRSEAGKLLGSLILADAGSSTFVDELRALVKQGILRAISVGFEVIQMGKPGGPWEIERQLLREASLVAVGSNSNALALARSLNISESTIRMVLGEQAEPDRKAVSPGEHAVTSRIRKSNVEKSLTQRIEDAQNDVNTARDALTAHIAADDSDDTQTETLSGEIETREAKLASLKRAEKALAARTIEQPANGNHQLPMPAVRRPLGVAVKEPKPEDLFIRSAAVHLLAHTTGKDPMRVLEERYGDHEATQIVTRAAIAGATTTTSGWAAEIVETATTSFLVSLMPIAAYPRLAALGTSLSFGPNQGAIKIPSRASTPSISGSFVVEGGAIPVRRIGLTSITLNPHKMAVISVFTKEIARYSNPQIEGLLREEIQVDTALTIDTLLIDATAVSTTRPAGLLYGVSAVTTSTDGGYFAIIADINSLAAPFDTANAGRRLALLMNPREARNMAMAPGPDGKFGWAAQFMSEFNVIVSSTIPAGTLIMVDAADFVSVGGSAPEFDVSEHTSLHMEDTTPLAIGTAGTPTVVAAPVQSMFQTASIALRMILPVTWAMRRSGMVQFTTTADWTPVVP